MTKHYDGLIMVVDDNGNERIGQFVHDVDGCRVEVISLAEVVDTFNTMRCERHELEQAQTELSLRSKVYENVGVPPLLKNADPELERLLAEEEEIERTTRAWHENSPYSPAAMPSDPEYAPNDPRGRFPYDGS